MYLIVFINKLIQNIFQTSYSEASDDLCLFQLIYVHIWLFIQEKFPMRGTVIDFD